MEKRERNLLVRASGILVSLIILWFFIYSIINYAELKEDYTSIEEPDYILIFLTTVFLEGFPQLVPATLLLTSVILSGVAPHMVILTVTIASLIGSLLGYYLGYYYGEKAVDVFMPKKHSKEEKRIRDYINRYGKIIVAVVAVTPLPYFPILFGSIRMKLQDFLIYGAIVRALSYVMYGYFVWAVLF